MSIELPPLQKVRPRHSFDEGWIVSWEDYDEVFTAGEARERILLARVERLELTVQELGLRNAELEADAERYRWLRDFASNTPGFAPLVYMADSDGNAREILYGRDLDAAIDAARGAK